MEPPGPQPDAPEAPWVTDGPAGRSKAQPLQLSPADRLREARARHRRAMRQFLIVGLCFVALLCLGGAGVGFLYYDKATKPDLSTPGLVTRKYLSAYLVNHDDTAAAQYQCADTSGLAPIRALRADLDDRQRKYNLTISVSVDSVREETRSSNQADVAADIVLSAVTSGDQLNRLQHWLINTRNEGGWRVCGGHEVT